MSSYAEAQTYSLFTLSTDAKDCNQTLFILVTENGSYTIPSYTYSYNMELQHKDIRNYNYLDESLLITTDYIHYPRLNNNNHV